MLKIFNLGQFQKKGLGTKMVFNYVPRCKQTHNLETSVITLSQAVNAEKCSNEKKYSSRPDKAGKLSLSEVEKP